MTTWAAAILIVLAVAMFVAAPLCEGLLSRRGSPADGAEWERLEHQRSLALQGLRELEFDRAMGKLEESDYSKLKLSLEQRALSAMSALEKVRAPARALRLAPRRRRSAGRSLPAASGAPTTVNFCPQCGTRIGLGHSFCANCGAALAPDARVAGRAE